MSEKGSSGSLLVTSIQVSNPSLSFVLPTGSHNRPHRYFDLFCLCCGHRFPVPVYCGFRFCRICSVRRQSRVRRRLKWLVSMVRVKHPFGIKHLTLTIPNGKNLPVMVQTLVKSFRRLRQRAYWKNHVLGGAFVIEITGRPGNWHAHIHAILHARYMDWGTLHKMWISCSGGRGLYITKLSKSKACNYLTKYLTKSDAPFEVIESMSAALKGTRLFSPFGQWYALNRLYSPPDPLCPSCEGGELILYDVFLYGKWQGTYTRYD